MLTHKKDFYSVKTLKMSDEFHILYPYRKIQQVAATTNIRMLEQVLAKFIKVVAERCAGYYPEIGEEAAR